MTARLATAFANLWLLWLAALAATTWLKLWRADSSLTGLVRSAPTGEVRAERIQNLAVFLFLLAGYAQGALRTPLDPQRPSLPDAPAALLALLAGSNGLYLVKKALDARTAAGEGEG